MDMSETDPDKDVNQHGTPLPGVRRIVTPYLIGQRRNGLLRAAALDTHDWMANLAADLHEETVGRLDEKFRRMGVVYAALAAQVEQAARQGARVVSLAGDCLSSLGVLAGLQGAGREPDCILWLDAHGDFHTWATTHTRYPGGMPLAMLVGRGDRRSGERDTVGDMLRTIGVHAYPESQVVLSDARDLDPGEREALAASDIQHCAFDQVFDRVRHAKRLYVHWDTDVLDEPSQMPALKYHVSRGPRATDLARLFDLLSDLPWVAVSVSAWHADQDTDDATARLCLALLSHLRIDRV